MLKVWILTMMVGSGGYDNRSTESIQYNFTSHKECMVAAKYYKAQFLRLGGVRHVGSTCLTGYVVK